LPQTKVKNYQPGITGTIALAGTNPSVSLQKVKVIMNA